MPTPLIVQAGDEQGSPLPKLCPLPFTVCLPYYGLREAWVSVSLSEDLRAKTHVSLTPEPWLSPGYPLPATFWVSQ